MAWIELHQTVKKHRKTLRLSSLLGISRREAVGLLCDLWLWAIDNADKHGLLEGMNAEDIGMALDMSKRQSEKTVAALVESGYLDLSDGQYVLHDWYEYCGKLNEKRESDRKRKAESRKKSDGSPTEVTRKSHGSPLVTVPNLTVPNHLSSLRSDRESTAGTPASPPPEPKKPERHKYGEYKNVLLTDEELEKLKDEYPRDYSQRISRLSEYMASKGTSYKNHLATIRAWAKKDKDKPFTGKRVSFQAYDQTDQWQDTTYDRVGPDLLAEARAMTSKENE